jgi:hypothetical protein
VKALLDAVPETAARPAIEKYTGVLAAADVYTANTALWILESIRVARGVGIHVRPEHDRGRR